MSSATPSQGRKRPRGWASDDRIAGLQLVAVMLAIMWVVEAIDSADHHALDSHGIEPRDADGLPGIVFAPFLHASWSHLLGNTLPFVVLGAMTALGGVRRVLSVTLIVGLVGGVGVWLIAPSNTVHLGASGLVFGYATYLISRGLFERSALHLVVGAVVVVLYGGVLISALIPRDGISWQGHLFGGIGGVLAAYLLSGSGSRPAAAETARLRSRRTAGISP